MLKTVSSKTALAKRQAAHSQLAAYQSMLATHTSLVVTDLVTVVAGPGAVRILNTDVEDAWTYWDEAWNRYAVTLPSW